MPAYLFAAFCLISCFAVGWLLCPRRRGEAMLAALVLSPFAFLGAAFVPTYWQPDHAFTLVRGVGIEDVLFCFSCGGIAWLVAANGARTRRVALRPFLIRFVAWAAGSLGVVALAATMGIEILTAVIVGFAGVGILIAACRPELLKLAIPGSLGFMAIYAAVAWLVIAAYPSCTRFWVGSAIRGDRVFGLPVEEIVWAGCFGATWPVVFAFCLGPYRSPNSVARTSPSGQLQRSSRLK